MNVIFKLSIHQQNRAAQFQENISQELPDCLNMNWARYLLGYLAINVEVLLSLKGGDMVFSGTGQEGTHPSFAE